MQPRPIPLAIIVYMYLEIDLISSNQCFKPDKAIQNMEIGRNLQEFSFKTLQSLGPLDCARYCLRYALCQSVNYESVSRQCELMSTAVGNFLSNSSYSFIDVRFWSKELLGSCNNHNCNNNTFCREIDGDLLNQYVCVPFGCLGAPPPVTNINITSFTYKPVWYINETVLYACTAGYFPSQNVYCSVSGLWNWFSCRPFERCRQFKKCEPKHINGHYLFFSPTFSTWISLYCGSSYFTYLTLHHENIASYSIYYRNSPSCTPIPETSAFYSKMGSTTYHKYFMRLYPPAVYLISYEHTTNSFYRQKVGHAGDCYTGDNVTECGTKGYFIIDLRDTVFRVNATEEWVGFGNNSVINITRSYDNQVIEGHCGGNCGGCMPRNDRIYIDIVQGYSPPNESFLCVEISQLR